MKILLEKVLGNKLLKNIEYNVIYQIIITHRKIRLKLINELRIEGASSICIQAI